MKTYVAIYSLVGEPFQTKVFKAIDRSEARRIALQGCPSAKMQVECFELDENENIKGRII